ncbi:MAG: chromate transporter [Lentisphaeria bacterium]
MSVLGLYFLFLKLGFFCFGGGYMLIPLLSADLVSCTPQVLTAQAFSDLVSMAQVTPGPIGLNTATYVGYLEQGIPGALAASLGILTPAMILVLTAIKLLKHFETHWSVRGFLRGMKPASFGLIVSAAWIIAEMCIFSGTVPWRTLFQDFGTTFHLHFLAIILTGITVLTMLKTKISFMWVLAACGIFGAFFLG